MACVEEILRLCRLCLQKEDVKTPIFEQEGDIKEIFLKITTCLPVKVSSEDQLPKKICDDCTGKLDSFYNFWKTTVDSEKQLLNWLSHIDKTPAPLTGVKTTEKLELKQEIVDPPEIRSEEDVSSDAVNDSGYPQTHSEKKRDTLQTNDPAVSEEPPPKRARRSVTLKKHIQTSESDEDDDFDGGADPKVEEDDSDNSDDADDPGFGDEKNDEDHANIDDQPGPSGVGKSTGDQSSVESKKNENVCTEEMLFKKYRNIYKLYPCYVALKRIDLEELQRRIAAESYNSENSFGRRSRHYICYVCLAKFKNNTDLQTHKLLHENEENLEAVIKPVKEASLDILPQSTADSHPSHSSNSHDEQPSVDETEESYVFKCLTCSCYFKTGLNLFVHVRENKGRACKFYCDYCKKIFKYPVEFSQHITRHLGNLMKRKKKIDNRPLNSVNSAQPAGKYNCALCSKTFEDCFQRKRHLVLGHKVSESDIDKLLHENATKSKDADTSSKEATKDDEKVNDSGMPTDSNQTNSKVKLNFDGSSVLDERTGLFDGDSNETSFTCNICFDEFSSKADLESHIALHIELRTIEENPACSNTPLTNPKEKETNKGDDVIVIDDDDDENSTSFHKQITVGQNQLKHKKHRIRVQEVQFFPTPGQSVLKSNVLGNKTCPPLLFNNAASLQLLKQISPMQQQPTQMLLLSGFTPSQTGSSQDSSKVKLMKTGPTSFKLCYDADKTNQTNVTNTSTASVSTLVQSAISKQKTNLMKVGPLSQIPVINFRNVSSPAISGSSAPLIQPVIASTSSILPINVSDTRTSNTVISSISAVQNLSTTNNTCDQSMNPSVISQGPTSPHVGLYSDADHHPSITEDNSSTAILQNILSVNRDVTSDGVVDTNILSESVMPTISQPPLEQTPVDTETENIRNHISEGNTLDTNEVQSKKSSSSKQVTDTDNESDVDNLVIDEGESTETREKELLSTNTTNAVNSTMNDNVNKEPINTTDNSSTNIDRPKIFVRKLSDLMDPVILEKTVDKKKKQEKKEKHMKCTDCNQVFIRMRSLRNHNRKKHKCTVCDYENCRVHVMKHHYQSKHDLYLCTRCKILAENGYDLYKHNSESHICPDCKHPMTTYEAHKPKCTGKPAETEK